MALRNMSIKLRLGLAFGSIILIFMLVSWFAIATLGDAQRNFDSYVSGVSARSSLSHRVREAVDLRAIAARNLVLVARADDIAKEKAIVIDAHREVSDSLNQLKRLGQAPEVSEQARGMIAEIGRIEQAYAPVALNIVDLALKGQSQQAIAQMNEECRPLLAALIKVTRAYSDYTDAQSARLVNQARDAFISARNLLIGVSLFTLMLSALIAFLLLRAILKPVLEAVRVARTVASGDLTSKIVIQSTNETGQLIAALKDMQDKLADVVGQVRQGSQSVAAASVQISQGNESLSTRTDSQAASLEKTASAMEQLGTTVRQNAENAQQANQLAHSASEVAIKGGDVVTEVVNTMKGINEASKKISDIISVIDSIAFQTNILALNAAVEAARAGEQGKGFAVVAGEVRSLATRSAEAAREIKSLITESVSRVEQGTQVVDIAGDTMREIVGSIQRVSDIMSEISSASAEQSAGVAQIGDAVTKMDQATQQNMTLVEQMLEAATSLRAQSQGLVDTVAVFHLADTPPVPASASHRHIAGTRSTAPGMQLSMPRG